MKTVLVTGASTGLGRATAALLAADGVRVFAGVRRAGDAPPGTEELRLDVTDDGAVAAAATTVADVALDGLVNNAGICVTGPLEGLPVAEFRRQLDVNLTGVLRVTQAFLPHVRRAGGRIVNIGSVSGRAPFPLLGAYNASKFGLAGMTGALRQELRPEGIEVCLLEPGPVRSEIWERSAAEAQRLRNDLLPAVRERYDALYRGVLASVERSAKTTPGSEIVARAVRRLLTMRRPPVRSTVAMNRFAVWLFDHVLPDRWCDAIVLNSVANAR